jgi:hypothetical protein
MLTPSVLGLKTFFFFITDALDTKAALFVLYESLKHALMFASKLEVFLVLHYEHCSHTLGYAFKTRKGQMMQLICPVHR